MLLTGDIFHHPQARRVSHELVNDLLTVLADADMPIFIVPGNHDIGAGRLESIPKQPLGSLGHLPNVTVMEDGKLYEQGSITLASVGWNYRMDADYIRAMIPAERPHVLALHAPVTPAPNPFFKTIQPAELAGLAEVVCYGHIHTQHPILQVGDTLFSNPGALARRALGGHLDDEAASKPHIAEVDFSYAGSNVYYVEIPHRPMEEVYRLDLHEVAVSDNEALTTFVESLGEVKLTALTAENLVQEAQALTDDVRVKEMLSSVFSQVL